MGSNDKYDLNPEERLGFQISEKRKKIWAVELDLLRELQRVCEKHGLSYYAINGTLLGAVRHQGFIPWDDDVDIAMPRADYDRLRQIAAEEFQSPYCLNCPDEQGVYFRDYDRLMNLNTTALSQRDIGRNGKKGIFIDIFPLDGRPGSDALWEKQKEKILFYRQVLLYAFYPDFKPERYGRKVKWTAKIHRKMYGFQGMLDRFYTLQKQYSDDTAEEVFQLTHKKFKCYSKAFFAEKKIVPFENITIPISVEFDAILRQHYGDYMVLPEESKRGEHHNIFFDPDQPYQNYDGKMTPKEAKERANDY